MNKAQKLAAIKTKLEQDTAKLPLAGNLKDTVPGEGNPDADILFIGEAAGYHEHVQRRPFVGRAGQLLNQSLQEINLKRSEVYITNILKVRPPNNRDPLPEEIAAYKPYLDAEINIIQPKIIATLGRFSMGKFIQDGKISQIHGQPRWVEFHHHKYLIMPLYHPAAALRNGFVLTRFKQDFSKLPHILRMINQPKNISVKTHKPQPSAKPEATATAAQLSLI